MNGLVSNELLDGGQGTVRQGHVLAGSEMWLLGRAHMICATREAEAAASAGGAHQADTARLRASKVAKQRMALP
ncbi:hypothetical protein CUTER_09765 [Corynebacterium uterequi]|uniref:Uncharacterized protein n=1 Tax=Corynebacterium uterequi TaxID=1072256 RepID=A0A0G3HEZ6_9CORY|nr:hypothetical protein CUTER_09765 [Corynebacterium uterequi]